MIIHTTFNSQHRQTQVFPFDGKETPTAIKVHTWLGMYHVKGSVLSELFSYAILETVT